MLQIVLLLSQVSLPALTAQQASPPWTTDPWEEGARERQYRQFTKTLADAKWGPTGQLDVPDQKTCDKWLANAAAEYKQSATVDHLFRLLAVLAYNWSFKVATEFKLEEAIKNLGVHVQSYEFARVAYFTWAKLKFLPPRLDLADRLLGKNPMDATVLEAFVEDSDKVIGLKECHVRAVQYASDLVAMYPKRDEFTLRVQVLATYHLWCRNKDPETLALCKESIAKALAHPQLSEAEKDALRMLREKLSAMAQSK